MNQGSPLLCGGFAKSLAPENPEDMGKANPVKGLGFRV